MIDEESNVFYLQKFNDIPGALRTTADEIENMEIPPRSITLCFEGGEIVHHMGETADHYVFDVAISTLNAAISTLIRFCKEKAENRSQKNDISKLDFKKTQ